MDILIAMPSAFGNHLIAGTVPRRATQIHI
jgi:hypothetical protein